MAFSQSRTAQEVCNALHDPPVAEKIAEPMISVIIRGHRVGAPRETNRELLVAHH